MFNSYKQLFQDLNALGKVSLGGMHSITDEQSRKIVVLYRMGIITIKVHDNTVTLHLNKPKKGTLVVLAHPNGIAQLKHTVDGRNGDYTIIKHPVLNHKLYRKVAWNETINGWVAA